MKFRWKSKSRSWPCLAPRVDSKYQEVVRAWQRWGILPRAARIIMHLISTLAIRLERRASTLCWLRRTGRCWPRRDPMLRSCESMWCLLDTMNWTTMTGSPPNQVVSPPLIKASISCERASNPSRHEDKSNLPSSPADSTSKHTRKRCSLLLICSRTSSHLMRLNPFETRRKFLNPPPKATT